MSAGSVMHNFKKRFRRVPTTSGVGMPANQLWSPVTFVVCDDPVRRRAMVTAVIPKLGTPAPLPVLTPPSVPPFVPLRFWRSAGATWDGTGVWDAAISVSEDTWRKAVKKAENSAKKRSEKSGRRNWRQLVRMVHPYEFVTLDQVREVIRPRRLRPRRRAGAPAHDIGQEPQTKGA